MNIVALGILSLLFLPVHADMANSMQIKDAFARSAIQQQRNSAVFMTIHNPAAEAAVTYANSPVAEIVELHTHINDQGVMRMRKIRQIDVPAGATVELRPGGLHVMLLGLNRDLKVGDGIPVTLGFSDGSERILRVPVRKVMMRHGKGKKMPKSGSSMPGMMRH